MEVEKRPKQKSSKNINIFKVIKNYSYSVQYVSFIFGLLSVFLGLVLLIFIRDLQLSGTIIIIAGSISLSLSVLLNMKNISGQLLSSRGLYGANTFFILIALLFILFSVNALIYTLNSRGTSPEWFRSDVTASKEYELSNQAVAAINNIKEDIDIFIFIRLDSGRDKLALTRIEALLSEFSKKSSSYDISYNHVDPDLEPNLASNLNIDKYLSGRDLPILVFRTRDSQRTSFAVGKDVNNSIDIFNEADLITSLLVINQIKQKSVLFLTGHEERGITDENKDSSSLGQAKISLERDNYIVGSVTTDELARILINGNIESFPAALIIADPKDDLLQSEINLIQEYLKVGGNLMLLLDAESPSSYENLVAPWGLVIGKGILVDTVSYVAPNIEFLQVKDTNLQMPEHPITHDFDVIYFPGSRFIGMSLRPEEIPVTDDGVPHIKADPLAYTTLNSWQEVSKESIQFDQGIDLPGPLPVLIAVESISDINSAPTKNERNIYIKSKFIVSGDTDFASNKFLFSAKNEDLFANSVNWLTSDVELISIRPKTKVFRELVLTQDERNFVRWAGWLFLPLGSLLMSILAWWRRR
jgi:ABC-type uncharacterized transport system involved in gliding motility auxiliary subunit